MLADCTGLSRSRVNRIKNRRAVPTVRESLLMSRALELPVQALFWLTEDRDRLADAPAAGLETHPVAGEATPPGTPPGEGQLKSGLRALLAQRELSGADMACMTGLPYAALLRILQDQMDPPLPYALRIARALDVPIDAFFSLRFEEPHHPKRRDPHAALRDPETPAEPA